MKRFKIHLITAAAFAVLAITLTLTNSHSASAEQKEKASTPVTIVDPLPLPVLAQDSVGRHPFSINLTVPTGGPDTTFTVPPNQRLVITYVDAFTAILPDNLGIRSTANGGFSELLVRFSKIDVPVGFGGVHYQANEQVLGFADPGTTVRVIYFAFGSGDARVNIHGYFVDLP